MSSYREFEDFASGSTSGDGGFQSGAASLQSISSDMQLFNKNVSILERRLLLLNGPQDNSTLRHEIIDMVGDTVQLAKMARTSIDKVRDKIRTLSPAEKMQFDRLVSTFKSSVSKFQNIQQSTSELEQEMLSRARSASTKQASDFLPESERGSPSLRSYEVADQHFNTQKQAQLEQSASDLEQREREMGQLEHDILDINDIFRDLGTMVHEQGDTIDNIESNVETAVVRVEAGNEQLESAVRHKRCSRKLTCIIAAIIIGVVVVLIIVVVVLACAVGRVCSSNN